MNLLNLTKEFIKSKELQTLKNILGVYETKNLEQLKSIILNLDMLTNNESLKYYYTVANKAETIGVFNVSYETLLMDYAAIKKEFMQLNVVRDFQEIQIVIKGFLEISLKFLKEMDEVQNITDDEKNTFKRTGIVLAFYHVFIQPELSVPVQGGRKRISKSFNNSRIRRKSHRRRCRTVKSRRLRRRRSVKRRRL